MYVEETPDTNISDTFNELRHFLVHNCFNIFDKKKCTLISHPFRGLLGFIPFPFPKAIEVTGDGFIIHKLEYY